MAPGTRRNPRPADSEEDPAPPNDAGLGAADPNTDVAKLVEQRFAAATKAMREGASKEDVWRLLEGGDRDCKTHSYFGGQLFPFLEKHQDALETAAAAAPETAARLRASEGSTYTDGQVLESLFRTLLQANSDLLVLCLESGAPYKALSSHLVPYATFVKGGVDELALLSGLEAKQIKLAEIHTRLMLNGYYSPESTAVPGTLEKDPHGCPRGRRSRPAASGTTRTRASTATRGTTRGPCG